MAGHLTWRLVDEHTTERSRVRRLPERGRYDRDIIEEILDEALICHVGFVVDDVPYVIPTIHARVGSTLYFHGSPASRMLRFLEKGAMVSATATIVDGLVVARALFHHSMNYRSVVVFGVPRLVDDPEERAVAFRAITEHVLPGRWDEARRPNPKEDRGTLIVAMEIDEASAKVRSGPPGDDEEDYALDIWAGVIPLTVTAGDPEPDPRLKTGVEVPESVRGYPAG
jgi:nitroimidazol reductase NimA-like FMN-containing flavoprotein (pyridoxamine 5'-phosphate oxidase superfamily)